MSSNLFAGEKPKRANSIVDLHKDHLVARLTNHLSRIEVVVRVACVATALDKEPDRKFGSVGDITRRKDV